MMQEHYFTQQSTDPASYVLLRDQIGSHNLQVWSAPGLFAAKSFDKGTKALLTSYHVPDVQDLQILDLGCGYGVVSVFFAQKFVRQDLDNIKTLHIDACDISPRALDLTRHNLTEYYHKNFSYKVVESDGLGASYFADRRYDSIMTNPPFSVGKRKVQELLVQAYDHLNPGGMLRVVIPTKRGAKSYIKRAQEYFAVDQVVLHSIVGGFRVWTLTKS